MKRKYKEGIADDLIFFIGFEVEKTPAYGKKTLFVVGLQNVNEIADIAHENECDHIYLGANHSYNAVDYESLTMWEDLAKALLDIGFWVTLDLDYSYYTISLDLLTMLCGYNRFIPQISAKLPYIENLNYNTCIKIDDKDFDATNPGVWIHHLHDLKDRSKFTDWSQYESDKGIEKE
jgi:hypothetical protein